MPQSKFQSVADQLRKRVLRGYYNASQKLPSEYVLAQEFGVSRLTLRKAIDQLIADQVLVKNPGKGTYIIQGQDKVESGRMGLQSFTEVARLWQNKPH